MSHTCNCFHFSHKGWWGWLIVAVILWPFIVSVLTKNRNYGYRNGMWHNRPCLEVPLSPSEQGFIHTTLFTQTWAQLKVASVMSRHCEMSQQGTCWAVVSLVEALPYHTFFKASAGLIQVYLYWTNQTEDSQLVQKGWAHCARPWCNLTVCSAEPHSLRIFEGPWLHLEEGNKADKRASDRAHGNGSKLHLETFRLDIRESFFKWSNSGTSILERWSMPQVCQCLRGIWTVPLITGFNLWLVLKWSGRWAG